MTKLKVAIVAGIVILLLVLIFQNMEAVHTRLLFATVSMPHALLILIVFGLGFLAGLMMRMNMRKTRSTAG